MDIWFQDEARIGQQGSTTRLWAKKGTRPRAVKQRQFISTYIYGAVCPSLKLAVGLILPKANSECMILHIDEISKAVPKGRHALVIVDGAAWHGSKHNLYQYRKVLHKYILSLYLAYDKNILFK